MNEFQIPFVGLAIGEHIYSFNIKETFFTCFETSEVKFGSLKCKLILEKKSDMLILDFIINGYVDLECDLCLGSYPQDLELKNRLIVKFGDYYQEQTDEIIVIPATQQEINVSQHIFEFIHLGLPVKKIHPGGLGDRLNCDKEVIKKLKELSDLSKKKQHAIKHEQTQWDELKKLKFD